MPAVSAGDHYLNVGRLRLEYRAGSGVTVTGWDLLPVDEAVAPDPQVAALVEQAKAGIAAKYAPYGDVYKDVVGYAPWPVSKRYDPERPVRDTAMGNLVTDALRYRSAPRAATERVAKSMKGWGLRPITSVAAAQIMPPRKAGISDSLSCGSTAAGRKYMAATMRR